ncbi:hypothetical protein H2203_007692 [Taxawa tesnikishii (nom. ined.)]|nr:hypothetical protein H2203_007692 [Dothideales sp. JES 119]
MASQPIPSSILIVGSGVFGLSTAYSLSQNPSFANTRITLLDRSAFPSPDGASIDSSRIVRSDYADYAYADLALRALREWRKPEWQDVYHETGLALIVNHDDTLDGGNGEAGREYMRKSMENVRRLGLSDEKGDIQVLRSRKDIEGVVNTGGGSEATGKVAATGRVEFVHAAISRLLFAKSSGASTNDLVEGVELADGSIMKADLTILATGAWTPKFLDLRGITSATGQILAYTELSAAEQEMYGKNPTLMNESTGMFIIPPQGRVLKVARHGYGYGNPTQIPNPENPSETITVSLPRTKQDDPNLWIPPEGLQACRHALAEMIPALKDRPFTYSRICWYTDTPKGDWIVSYHPRYKGLFVATGGSGHGYKFLPVIGDEIVKCVVGETPEAFREKWAWPTRQTEDHISTDDWRGGRKGMILDEELGKGSRL